MYPEWMHPGSGTTSDARPDVHDFPDYRSFLREAIARAKASGQITGHRDVATALGLRSPGHITWILQGKRNLVPRLWESMANLLGLSGKDRTYFDLLVRHDDEMDPEERRKLSRQLSRMQSSKKKIVPERQFLYWTTPRHAVVRELVGMERHSKNDPSPIARRIRPAATAQDVAGSLELLLDLGLVESDENGILRRKESLLSTGGDWKSEAVRGFQNSILQLSSKALHEIPKEERDISTVTFSVSHERMRRIRSRIREMREEILALVRTDPNPQEVFHLAISLFPATTPAPGAPRA